MVSCKGLEIYTTENPKAVPAAQNVIKGGGQLLAPLTGGISVPVSHILAAALPTVLAVNRWLVGRKAKKQTREIVGALELAKNSDGVIDFTDSQTKATMRKNMTRATQAIVASERIAIHQARASVQA